MNLQRYSLAVAIATISTAVLAVIADMIGVLEFFTHGSGQPLLAWISRPLVYEIVIVTVLLLPLLALILAYRRINALQRRLSRSHRRVADLLDLLYADSRFDLVRYERSYQIVNTDGDAVVHMTYVLKARSPQTEMTCYVEAVRGDDVKRIFKELKSECSGGEILGTYHEHGASVEDKIIIGFVVTFPRSIEHSEHTLTMGCTLKQYLPPGNFVESIHMALPTRRSILRFQFPPALSPAAERTIMEDLSSGKKTDWGNQLFFRDRSGELKWEVARDPPLFGCIYTVTFDILSTR
jgi:hypothetical protein